MNEPEEAQDRIAALERQLAARDKTIAALVQRQVQGRAQESSALHLLEQNLSLGRIIERKTQELATERAQLEQALGQLKRAQTRLLQAQKLESIGQLAAGIAHEINTPTQFVSDNLKFLREAALSLLDVVGASASLAERARAGGDLEPALAAFAGAWHGADVDYLREQIPLALDQSAEGMLRIATIVKAMKQFAHASGETMTPEDLEAIVRAAATVARNEWKTVADLTVEAEPGLPLVPCLRGEIGQLVLNLVVNSAHAIAERMAQGNPARGRIAVTLARRGPMVELRCADDGTGIPEAIRDRVFDPFFTTKEVGKGTGQGLALAFSTVVEQHHGEIRFESEPGVGACFIVHLPLQVPEAPPA